MRMRETSFKVRGSWLLATACILFVVCFGLLKVESRTNAAVIDKGSNENREKTTSAETKMISAKDALAEFNNLVGGWRGVAMPRANSTEGAWIEKAEWLWEFQKGTPGIRYSITNGKLLKSVRVTWDSASKLYLATAEFTDKSTRLYSGKKEKNRVIFESKADSSGDVYRMTITRLNEKRTLVLHERRRGDAGLYLRVAEVGYTRAGTSLAIEGAGEPICVVTGGKGTTKVMYKGETYYVCCSGCKQAFDDDPAGIVAEYKKRLLEQQEENRKKLGNP